jgi:hypothetical protein
VTTNSDLESVLDIGVDMVARIDADMIGHAQLQVYARAERFRYVLAPGQLRIGGDLLCALAELQGPST